MKGEKQNMNKLFTKIAKIFLGLSMAAGVGVAIGANHKKVEVANATDACSFSRSSSTDTVTSGYTMVLTNYKGNADNYQDKSGSVGLDIGIKKSSGTIWSTTPSSISLTVKVGGGSTKNPLTNAVTANLIDSSGTEISGTSVTVTTKVETTSGKNYTVSVPVANNAAGIMVHHTKESSYNVRVYSISLSYVAGGGGGGSTYTVTYDGNGKTSGTVPTDDTAYSSGASVTVKGNTGSLTKTGYTFGGWNTNEGGTGTNYAANATFTISANTTLYAKWNPNQYSISYYDEGGETFSGTFSSTAPTTHTYGTATTLLAPTKDGYAFVGWFTSSNCSSESKLSSLSLGANDYTANISLYAQWSDALTYQHVFNAKPSTGNGVTLSGISWNITATQLGSYNSGNYAGVQVGNSNNSGSITLTSANNWGAQAGSSYYGMEKITEVRLWLNTGGSSVTPSVSIGGKVATSDGTTVVKNSSAGSDWTKATKVTFTPVSGGNTGVVVINVDTAKAGYICAVEIDCKPATFTVTYDDNGKTSGSVPTDNTAYKNGDTVTVLGNTGSLAKTGYTFGGWNDKDDGTGNNYAASSTFTISSDTTLYAKWTPNQYAINYYDQGGSAFSGTHASGYPTQHTYGTATALKGAEKSGYTFGGWFTSQDCSGTAVSSLGATAYTNAINLYGKWTINSYTITWKNSDGTTLGTDSVQHGNTPSYTGSTPTKASDQQYTYNFTGWSPTIVAATAAATYTAVYSSTLRTYTVGGGTITNGSITSTTVNYGTSATVTITPAEGYRLPGSLGTVTMNGDPYAGAQYNSSNGQVTIPSVEGPVVINAECPVDSGTEYSIETHLTGCTTNAPASMYDGDIIEISISVSAHYKLPDTVTVTGGVDVSYSKEDGTIIIDGAEDDVDITITCIALAINDINLSLSNVTSDSGNPTEVEEGEEVELYFTAAEGYFLPEDIEVSGLEEDFMWDEDEGVLYFVAETSDIDIEITAVKIQLDHISISPDHGNHTLGTAFTKPAVTAYYNDGSSKVVTTFASFSSPAYDDGMFITAGNQTVTLSYTEDGVTKTVDYAATVSAKTLPTQTTWTRVTSVAELTAGGTFIMGYETDANSGTIIPMRSDECAATTSANGILYSGADASYTSGSSTSMTVANGNEYEDFLVYISSPASELIDIQLGSDEGNYIGVPGSSANSARLYASSGAGTTRLTPTLGSNDHFTLAVSGASVTNDDLRYNTGAPRFAFYNGSPSELVFYKRGTSTVGNPSLIQLTATGPAANTRLEGDTLTAENFVATAHYDTGAEKSVTPVIEEGPTTLAYGSNTFVLSYTEGVKKQCTVTVIAAENTAELDGIVWSQEGVSRTIFEGSAIGSFGTLQEHFDNDTTLNLDVANCTVAVYNNTSGSKAHDIANVASYTWNLSNDNGKYLGVTYEGYTKYSGVINVVETIEDVVGKVETMTFTTKASESNPIAVGETVVFTYDEENMELTGINNSIGVASSFSTNPAGTFPLTVVSGNTSGSVAFKNGSDYLKSISDNKLTTETSITDASSWNISYEDDVVTITNVSTGREIHYNTSSGQSRFCAYLSTNTFPCIQVYKGVSQWVPGSGPSIANTNAVAQKVVLEFAEHFNDVMECVNDGTTTNVSGKWEGLAEDFDNWFANGDKDLEGDDLNHAYALFAGADAVEGGDTLQDMLARYEYICAKYKLDDFLNDVADRPPVAKSPAVNPLPFIVNGINTNTVAIIVIISMVSVTAIGGYFFLRKRKENN